MFTNGLQAGLPQQVLDQSNLTNLGHSHICQVTGIAFIRGGPPTSVLTQTGYSYTISAYFHLCWPCKTLCVCVGVYPVSGRTHIIFVGTLLCCIWAGWFHSHSIGQRPVFSHPNFIVPGKAPCLVVFPLYTLFMFVFYRIIAHAH